MLLSTNDGTALFGLQVSLDQFPRLVELHLKNVANTRELEAEAESLIAGHFVDSNVSEFVKNVCKWGGGARVYGRVLRENSPEEISQAFIRAPGRA
jgi:ACT domain-containing protein